MLEREEVLAGKVAKATQIDCLHKLSDTIDLGLALIDDERRILLADAQLGCRLGLPPELLKTGRDFAEVVKFCHARGDYEAADGGPSVTEMIATFTAVRLTERCWL